MTGRCPRCSTTLALDAASGASSCPHGHGDLVPLEALLRRHPDTRERLAQLRAAQPSRVGVACPACGERTRVLHAHAVDLDVCSECHASWMDAGERPRMERAGFPRPSAPPGGWRVFDAVDFVFQILTWRG